ncbi:hypothetical protein M0534_04385 [Methylonatrum kenyense]|uniref:PA3496 family putative envelope integrity protein n=1 Tax=Methylonatrum kenyense TaxID=455253 RepID=UPI0020C12A72|nr:hypothetical protein [Methylonatrum kenyense]MCK8515566.1 hypothetical protein [Methylonatrum kenyense]
MQELMHAEPDSGTHFDDDMLDEDRAGSRYPSASPRNARRSIEELLEERALRGILRDLDQDFPELG